jgi:hypothetical protein
MLGHEREGRDMVYRKGELSAATMDRDWPHQVMVPASAVAGPGFKVTHDVAYAHSGNGSRGR